MEYEVRGPRLSLDIDRDCWKFPYLFRRLWRWEEDILRLPIGGERDAEDIEASFSFSEAVRVEEEKNKREMMFNTRHRHPWSASMCRGPYPVGVYSLYSCAQVYTPFGISFKISYMLLSQQVEKVSLFSEGVTQARNSSTDVGQTMQDIAVDHGRAEK